MKTEERNSANPSRVRIAVLGMINVGKSGKQILFIIIIIFLINVVFLKAHLFVINAHVQTNAFPCAHTCSLKRIYL